jgi:hypothetical protein
MMENQTVPTDIDISENFLSLIQSRKQLNLMLNVALREAAVPQWFPAVDSESTQQILLNNLQLRTEKDREKDNVESSDITGDDMTPENTENSENVDKIDQKSKITEDVSTSIDSLSQLHALVYANMKSSNDQITAGDSGSMAVSASSNCMLLLKPHQIKYTSSSSLGMCIYIYMYVHLHIYICICI